MARKCFQSVIVYLVKSVRFFFNRSDRNFCLFNIMRSILSVCGSSPYWS